MNLKRSYICIHLPKKLNASIKGFFRDFCGWTSVTCLAKIYTSFNNTQTLHRQKLVSFFLNRGLNLKPYLEYLASHRIIYLTVLGNQSCIIYTILKGFTISAFFTEISSLGFNIILL